MVVNHEVVIEIHIKRAELTGFASLQLDLPPGFSAREIENSAASCTLSTTQVIWSWDQIESDNEEISLSVGITADTAAIGKKSFGASLYYIENNEKKSKDMLPAELVVLNEGESEKSVTSDSTSKGNSGATTESGDHQKAVSHAEPSGVIEVVRTTTNGSVPKEMLVEVSIKKGITKGFARYSDNLDAGFTAKALRTDGSSFSIADGKVKFVWVNVPDKEELRVTYVLVRQTSTSETNLKGEYSYLEHNQSKKSSPPDLLIRFEGADLTPEKKTTNTLPVASVTETKQPEVKPVLPETKTLESGEPQTLLKKQSTPLRFEVQIGAFSNSKVKAQTLAKKFGVRENIRSEFSESFSKFMVGKHTEYKLAREHRDNLVKDNNIKSSFVVAYNNGKRITVQEALMISNQKWFK